MSQSTFLIVVVSLQNLGFNLVHPVTPTFITSTGMQNWIFGASYAAMAITSFLFSKVARMFCLRVESRHVFALGCVGYAAMQLMFLTSSNESQVIFWRLLSGFFVALINVASLVYLVRSSTDEKRGASLTLLSTAVAVTTAIGYALGGILGNANYTYAFLAQAIVLVSAGLSLACLGHNCGTEHVEIKKLLHGGNPLHLGSDDFYVRQHVVAYLTIVLLSMGALTIYEQTLNFYLKDVLDYSPACIGYLKGAFGLITLVSNQCIALKLIRRSWLLRNIGVIFALTAIFNSLLMALNTGFFFIICNLLFTVFNALHLPMVQELVTSADNKHQDELVSLYSEMRSAGWVVGGIAAGVAYSVSPLLPFMITTALFASLAMLCLYGSRLQRRYRTT